MSKVSMSPWHVIGIDPAPSKDAVVYHDGAWEKVHPTDLRDFITRQAESAPRTLVAWDAPLSFGPTDLYDRTVDKVVRAWVMKHVGTGHFSKKAINARAFAGLPHWVVSCVSLGLPFGTPPLGLRLADVPALDSLHTGLLAIEVHPAVAIGAWWLASACPEPLPRYKGDPAACASIAARLGFPSHCGSDDDVLDAFVAHRLGELFVQGQASWVGNPCTGGYVMPLCQPTEELLSTLSIWGSAA